MISDVPNWVYSIIESFILKIDVDSLKWMVGNNQSLLLFTLNHPNKDVVLFWLNFFRPFVDLKDIDENKVLDLFYRKRPDIYKILTTHPGWLHKQFVEISHYLSNNKIF